MKNHRGISPRQEAAAERALFQAVLTLRSVEECRDFFRDLCTPAELEAMSDRWAVVEWLERRGKLTFSHQELWQAVKGGERFAESSDLDRTLSHLARHGYVREVPRARQGPGRPSRPDFEVNPAAMRDRSGVLV